MTKESFSPYSPLDYVKTAEDLEAYVQARIEEIPKPVGFWCFGNCTKLAAYARPRWLTRVLMRWLLQWDWQDAQS